jgi:tetratricopeptide (TPR) repeat protein
MRPIFILAICLASFCPPTVAQDANKPPVAVPAELPAAPSVESAHKLYREGKFLEASQQYDLLIKADRTSVPASVGLIQSYLKMQLVKPAFDFATAALAANPDAPALHAVMGDVQFRRGDMAPAESEYRAALKLDNRNVQAALGLARIYHAFSLYRRAYDLIKTVHSIAPDDSEVQREWMHTLPRSQRIKAIEDYLKKPAGEDSEAQESLRMYVAYLVALQQYPKHGCEQVTNVESTEVELQPLLTDARHLHGWGINVMLNDQKIKLDLDTGASGFVLSRRMAEKANVTRLSDAKANGIGDKGPVSSYTGYVSTLKIGDLEFHDCIVDVIDRRSVVDDDGLIGADVFSSYLIDIDFPGKKLKLSPLPRRPDETVPQKATLNTGGDKSDSDAASTQGEESSAAELLPKDRFIASELQQWTKVFRFGHMLLIPTKVNDGSPKLFLIDTGAFANTFSTEFAREITKVRDEEELRVKGISGYVQKVYSADKASLAFAHIRQQNEDTVTFDLSNISRHTGTEISGILGYATMAILELKIDYRDGLVDFVYDPKRTHTENWRTK